MHYRWHYGLMGTRTGELKDILEQNYHIKTYFSPLSNRSRSCQIVFDLEETHPQFEEIVNAIAQDTWDDSDYPAEGNGVRVYIPVYSEEEYLSSKWLTVRSSFSKVYVTNEDQLCHKACIFGKDKFGHLRGRHVFEAGGCVVKSPVKWGRTRFASSMTNESRLFCDDAARSILEQHQISGIEFLQVIKKSTKQPMDDIHQLINTFTVPNGGIVGLDYTTDYVCSECGMNMLCWSDQRFKFGIRSGSIPEGLDFCRTLPLFLGSEPDKTYGAHALTLISQKMYRTLKDNMLDRSLWFEPVDIIE